jgi:predicted dehydrogenase
MFDMGPYYLTALLNLLGPVKRISGMSAIEIADRTITSEPKKGTKISVETPDHVCGLMEFEGGAIGTIIQTFATRFAEFSGPNKQPITIFGTDGTLRVPDPNQFDGPVHIRMTDDAEWREVPHSFVKGYGRSVGLADMAYAIRSGRAHRCSGEQAFAVLDLMAGFQDSADAGRTYAPAIHYSKPAPMRADLPFGVLDS